MVIKIVHASDWHGKFMDAPWATTYLPWADLYLFTGDMLKNYPKYDSEYCTLHGLDWIDPVRETYHQARDVRKMKFRKRLGNPNGEVVCLGGNHDYVHFSNAFRGGPTHEIESPSQIVDACGLRIGGFRGVHRINGDWADELTYEQLERRVEALSFELDILLTHSPPYGVMDKVGSFGSGPAIGIRPLDRYHNRQTHENGPLKLHCFGHVHQNYGHLAVGKDDRRMVFSNAATGFQEYVWRDGNVQHVGGRNKLFTNRGSDGYGER